MNPKTSKTWNRLDNAAKIFPSHQHTPGSEGVPLFLPSDGGG